MVQREITPESSDELVWRLGAVALRLPGEVELLCEADDDVTGRLPDPSHGGGKRGILQAAL
jgi:hypothetical protein